MKEIPVESLRAILEKWPASCVTLTGYRTFGKTRYKIRDSRFPDSRTRSIQNLTTKRHKHYRLPPIPFLENLK